MFSTILRSQFTKRVLASLPSLESKAIEKSTKLCDGKLINQPLNGPIFSVPSQSYHAMTMNPTTIRLSTESMLPPTIVQVRFFKMKGKLKLRCRDCYFVKEEDGTRKVLCETHPRHKQIKIRPPAKVFWILTHATNSRLRPW
ncbi:hypothetical protein CHUAL_007313 [Chamberlinius hualienensis]